MQPNQYNEKIDTATSQFISVIDDFKKHYTTFHMHPEVSEYQNYYSDSKEQLKQISKEVASLSKNINTDIDDIFAETIEAKKTLAREKKIYAKQVEQLNRLKNSQNGSDTLVQDSISIYNQKYYKNWEMFLGLVILSVLISPGNRPAVNNSSK
jgi:uncharacterized protein (DUF342 family)